MEKAVKHTALPWTLSHSDVSTITGHIKPNPGVSLEIPVCEIVRTGAEFSEAEENANGRFIVEACNNYYSLKSQLSSLTTELEKVKEENERLKERLKIYTGAFKDSCSSEVNLKSEVIRLREALTEVRKHMTAHIPEKIFDMVDSALSYSSSNKE